MDRLRFIVFLFCAVASAAQVSAEDSVEIRFVGNLSRTDGDEQIVLRNFEALLIDGELNFFSILDDENRGCPWPESFGTFGQPGSPKPHLVFLYDRHTYTLPLPSLKFNLPDQAQVGSKWNESNWDYEIVDETTLDEQKALVIQGQERRGRRQKVTVNLDGVLLAAEMDVFMGQGDKFNLTLKHASKNTISAEDGAKLAVVVKQLIQLQSALGRRADTQLSQLSNGQIQTAAAAVPDLSAASRGTLLNEAVLRISRNVARQQRRVTQTLDRQKQLLNKPAPGFSLSLISGGSLESKALAGKTVVLHFWEYSDKPLSEPYGQVGYLEFLFNKRKAADVAVVGVVMNRSLQQADQARAAKRSARKLSEFMNLSYPVGYDNGSLIRALGDPRESGGDLPLWVVISPDGNVIHYHSGFYEVDGQAGLKELVSVLDKKS